MTGYSGSDVSTPLDFEYWLSHDSILDPTKDLDVGYDAMHNRLRDTFTAGTAHTLNLNSDQTGASALVRTALYLFTLLDVFPN